MDHKITVFNQLPKSDNDFVLVFAYPRERTVSVYRVKFVANSTYAGNQDTRELREVLENIQKELGIEQLPFQAREEIIKAIQPK